MLHELAVTNLGVIDELRLVLGHGMTALTGETGAGKTMLVEAIDLLVGGRADGVLVRSGAEEAIVEGRFEFDGEEVVLTRVVPVTGRSRAYIDGRMATVGNLAEWGRRLVDLHGQHSHQSLLSVTAQRSALDRFGGVDLEPLTVARERVAEIDRRLEALGGDAGARAREIDLLRFQVGELEAAALNDPDEDRLLDAEESRLGDAVGHQEAAALAAEALSGDGGATDIVGAVLAAVAGREPFADEERRLRSVTAELSDIVTAARSIGEAIDEDPERLDAVRRRRQLLVDLRRKYGTATLDVPGPGGQDRIGSGTLADVLAYNALVCDRLEALTGHDRTAAELDQARKEAVEVVRAAEAAVGAARRRAAPALAKAVQGHLADLAMAKARVAIEVGEDPGDDVTFLLAANPGTDPLPLARVASGGELARAMLALRLVLSAAPPTLVFDEVDAGIGGEAALSVGRSLAALGGDHQVLVVTHLPQVAAFADAQVRIAKDSGRRITTARAEVLGGDDRVVELSRMLSGTPESSTARDHATELLAVAARERGR
jgi:DNA repair protein RecN (Recombination protein N)